MTETEETSRKKLPLGHVINVGSRNSQLALIQTKIVIEKLSNYYINNPTQLDNVDSTLKYGVDFNIIGMTTEGDRILDKALPDIGAKSLFTKDLEVALLEGKVDFIVHSLKDLPTTLPNGCVVGAILERDDPNDAIVLKKSLHEKVDPMDIIFKKQVTNHGKDEEIIIGTSSQRRIGMLRRCNSKLKCENIRGNLNTRLAKLDQDDGHYTAIILAKAGLNRLGWSDRISSLLTTKSDSRLSGWCYAVGQGAIAVECRQEDVKIIDLLAPLCDLKTTYETIAERSLMKKLEGGCSVPLGVRSTWLDNKLKLMSVILSDDGQSTVEASDEKDIEIHDNNKRFDPSLTTGIVVSDIIEDSITVRDTLLACSDLGVSLGNKMIELGCLGLMRGSK